MNSSKGWQFQGIQVWEGHTWPRASCPHLPIQYFTIICSNGDLNRTYSSGWHCATIASFIYFFYSYSIISLSRYPVTLKLPRQCQSIKEHNFICSQYFGRFVVFYLCVISCLILTKPRPAAGGLLRHKMHDPVSDTFLLPTSARHKILIFQGIF